MAGEKSKKKRTDAPSYYERNRDALLTYQRAYYHKNREAQLARQRAWYQENREWLIKKRRDARPKSRGRRIAVPVLTAGRNENMATLLSATGPRLERALRRACAGQYTPGIR